MNTNKLMEGCYDWLFKKFGAHYRAAEYLQISPSHYRGLRNGRYPLSPRLREYILSKATNVGFSREKEVLQKEAQQ